MHNEIVKIVSEIIELGAIDSSLINNSVINLLEKNCLLEMLKKAVKNKGKHGDITDW